MPKKQKKEKEKTKEEARKNKEEKSDLEGKLEHKYDKQVKYVFVVMLFMVIGFFVGMLIINESKKFTYGGLEFKKEKFDELPLYHAIIPIATTTGSVIAEYNLYLREDPRKLDIPIEGQIRLKKTIIMAVNKTARCPLEGVAGANFGQFLRAAGISKVDGTVNLTKAKEENLPFASCEKNASESVLIITEGNETKIFQKENCYVIEFANCELLQAVERFMIGIMAHSKGYKI